MSDSHTSAVGLSVAVKPAIAIAEGEGGPDVDARLTVPIPLSFLGSEGFYVQPKFSLNPDDYQNDLGYYRYPIGCTLGLYWQPDLAKLFGKGGGESDSKKPRFVTQFGVGYDLGYPIVAGIMGLEKEDTFLPALGLSAFVEGGLQVGPVKFAIGVNPDLRSVSYALGKTDISPVAKLLVAVQPQARIEFEIPGAKKNKEEKADSTKRKKADPAAPFKNAEFIASTTYKGIELGLQVAKAAAYFGSDPMFYMPALADAILPVATDAHLLSPEEIRAQQPLTIAEGGTRAFADSATLFNANPFHTSAQLSIGIPFNRTLQSMGQTDWLMRARNQFTSSDTPDWAKAAVVGEASYFSILGAVPNQPLPTDGSGGVNLTADAETGYTCSEDAIEAYMSEGLSRAEAEAQCQEDIGDIEDRQEEENNPNAEAAGVFNKTEDVLGLLGGNVRANLEKDAGLRMHMTSGYARQALMLDKDGRPTPWNFIDGAGVVAARSIIRGLDGFQKEDGGMLAADIGIEAAGLGLAVLTHGDPVLAKRTDRNIRTWGYAFNTPTAFREISEMQDAGLLDETVSLAGYGLLGYGQFLSGSHAGRSLKDGKSNWWTPLLVGASGTIVSSIRFGQEQQPMGILVGNLCYWVGVLGGALLPKFPPILEVKKNNSIKKEISLDVTPAGLGIRGKF